jgi:hypothetical protein
MTPAFATFLISFTPMPLPYVSTCPLGYYHSGSYCVPSPAGVTKPAIQREGNTCPLGYYQSGEYCVITR